MAADVDDKVDDEDADDENALLKCRSVTIRLRCDNSSDADNGDDNDTEDNDDDDDDDDENKLVSGLNVGSLRTKNRIIEFIFFRLK